MINAMLYPITAEPVTDLTSKGPKSLELDEFLNWQVSNSSLENWPTDKRLPMLSTSCSSHIKVDQKVVVDYGSDYYPYLAICQSGGLDSMIACFWAIRELKIPSSHIDLVFVDYGSPYNKKEIEVFKNLLSLYSCHFGVCRARIISLEGVKLDSSRFGKGYIIPNRNAVIASLAAFSYGINEIWISANFRKIDDEPGAAVDKNRRFFGTMTSLLSQATKSYTKVCSPFLHLSKSDIVKWFFEPKCSGLSHEVATELVRATTTCYDHVKLSCGHCFACHKKAAAFAKLYDELEPIRKLYDELYGEIHKNPEFKEYISRERAKGREIPKLWDKF
jgi:7-cyano-7-deazaguanine synthase in queuosine biosynthesis